MKRKLIVTLVASALELYAAAAGAQVSCQATDALRTVRTGPLNPVDGFPEFITDSNNLSVQRCLDPVVCFFDPIVTTDPFSLQIGSGGEAFYWSADAVVANAAGNRILTIGMAAETAFLQGGPNGEPVNGSQFPFLRLRFVAGVPTDGTYTIKHPFGTDTFTVVGATGARDIFSTVDRGFAPSDANVIGPVGPFLTPVRFDRRADKFVGDANGAADLVTGSPCGADWNRVEITGRTPAGLPIDFGSNEFVLTSRNFVVQGAVYDGKVQTALSPGRVSYSRAAGGAGQIDTFVTSSATAEVTVQDGPTIPVGSSQIARAVVLDHAALGPTSGINTASVTRGDLSALPPVLQLKASDPRATVATDVTTINVGLVDFVDIASAEYDPVTKVLTVSAASGDQQVKPVLTLRDIGTFAADTPVFKVTTNAPPAVVHVDSSAGGSASAKVKVVSSDPPAAPVNLTVANTSSTTVSLSWTDRATNESGYAVYRVNPTGAPTLVATLGQNATSYVVTGLSASTPYRFQVFASNAAGRAGSSIVDATTVALHEAPTAVAANLAAGHAIRVDFADNSADETQFTVSRATAADGPYTVVGTVAGVAGNGPRSYTDATGLANGATYYYRVTADRVVGTVVESSAAAQSASGLATPLPPASAGTPIVTALAANSVSLSWADRATNETAYRVYRRTGAGQFVLVSGDLPAGTTSFTDDASSNPASPPTLNTAYTYRVDAVNWAAAPQSGTVSVTTPLINVSLLPPTGMSATSGVLTAGRPVVSWTDRSTGESSYRMTRTPVTVGNDGALTVGTTSNVNIAIAANATTSPELVTQTTGAVVRYDVMAASGAAVGPAGSVYTVVGANLPAANIPTVARVNLTARVNVSWTALSTPAIGGYEIQRCNAIGAGSTLCAANSPFTKVTGTAVNTAGTVDGRATTTFADTTVARNANYVYRMRTVGGAGTGLVGATFSGVRAVSTN
ncbi:MAG: hypothetical protein RIQ60_984 [Pseudomonadota bacterium]|jgi:hypothetical protein